MAITYKCKGLKEVVRNLNRKIDTIPFKLKKGIIKAGLLIQREAQKIVPVDTGNLRASAFTVWDSGGRGMESMVGKKAKFVDINKDKARLELEHAMTVQEAQSITKTVEPTVVVGFSAYYALIQHECFPKKRNPRKEWKYLENAIKRNEAAILDQIRSTVK